MNYLPYCGYWFYGGLNATSTAAFYSSWGLLETAPGGILRSLYSKIKCYLTCKI